MITISALPQVSIVVPSFNQGGFLEKTIRSLIDQDYPKLEIIVIDGGSSDDSLNILKQYNSYFSFSVSEADSGQSEAINKGFREATGDIFAWLNSDDMLAPSSVKLAVSYLTAEIDLGLVYGDRIHIDSKGNIIGINRCPPFYSKMLTRNITIPQETAFFRRKLFETVGGLDENLHFAMDFDLWCKFLKLTKFRHIPAFMGFFREHGKSKSTVFTENKSTENYLAEHRNVFLSHFNQEIPGSWRSKYFRLVHKSREYIWRRTYSHKREIQKIRAIIHANVNVGKY